MQGRGANLGGVRQLGKSAQICKRYLGVSREAGMAGVKEAAQKHPCMKQIAEIGQENVEEIQRDSEAAEEACGKLKNGCNGVLTYAGGMLILVSSLEATLLDREANKRSLTTESMCQNLFDLIRRA